ncbi:MAG: hypothetical protein ABIP97_11435, partial [Chthoniobacterales bacterium]
YKDGYRDAKSTHVAFEISDATGHCTAYMPEKMAETLKKALLKHEPVTGKFLLTIDATRFDPKNPQIFAELLEVIQPSSLKN